MFHPVERNPAPPPSLCCVQDKLVKVKWKTNSELRRTGPENKKLYKLMQQKCLKLFETSFSRLECGGGEQVTTAGGQDEPGMFAVAANPRYFHPKQYFPENSSLLFYIT